MIKSLKNIQMVKFIIINRSATWHAEDNFKVAYFCDRSWYLSYCVLQFYSENKTKQTSNNKNPIGLGDRLDLRSQLCCLSVVLVLIKKWFTMLNPDSTVFALYAVYNAIIGLVLWASGGRLLCATGNIQKVTCIYKFCHTYLLDDSYYKQK